MRAPALARRRWRVRWAGALLAVATLVGAGAAAAQERIKGDAKVYTDGGYVRLMFRLDEDVGASVRLTGPVLVINFRKPVDIAVDRINSSVPDIISAARSDPDGRAVRIALARKVRINTIPAGERFYVDLLPESWTGVMPGLPQEVIDNLTRRTREAERELRRQTRTTRQWQPANVRVRVATQPTFTRYVFEMPDGVNVVPERGAGKVTLSFDQQIKWDLADARAALPPVVRSIDAETDFDAVTVVFTLAGDTGVRTFREDRSIVVDIDTAERRPPRSVEQIAAQLAAPPKASGPAIDAPDTVPVAPPAVPAVPDGGAALTPAPAMAAPPSPSPAVAAKPAEPPHAKAAEIPPPAVAPQPLAPAPVPPPVPAAAAPAPANVPAPAAMAAPPSVKPASPPARPLTKAEGAVAVDVVRSGDTLRLTFPFATPTPAAAFRRADALWLVFDSAAPLDLTSLAVDARQTVRDSIVERGADGETILRLRLTRPRLISLDADGATWIVTIADTVSAPTRPLAITRNMIGRGRASIVIPFDAPQKVHRIADPDIGDSLLVVTALAPARGFLKAQDFVELHALPATHGVVVQPVADDVAIELGPEKIAIGRPGGLSISSTTSGQQQVAPSFRTITLDAQLWGYDRDAPFGARQSELLRNAASAPDGKRLQARLNLARFYLARTMGAEAKAVLDIALAEQRDDDDVTGSILKSIADIMLERPEEALKELAAPQVANQQDAPVWRAVALAQLGRWPEARDGFKSVEAALAALPLELQRLAMLEALRACIEVRDYTGAARLINEIETIGVPRELEPAVAVLSGRFHEGMGRVDDALSSYQAAVNSKDRRASAQGRLHEILMQYGRGELPRQAAVADLETLTTTWRGDEIEAEGLRLLAHLYTEDGRYRDAFHVMRTALRAHPSSELTRRIQDEAASSFETLFLGGKGDALPPVEALGLFYDYRELTPIGRRGDEMIRKLADRLVSVDLLDQAAELLQHQVDHRLQGAARAQVATKLATVYLMNRKPERALATLQSTRNAELANELRDQRLLLEARALSEIGRHDVALELIADLKGREATRLRADVLWAARRWRDSAEQIELLHGERWKEFAPLNEVERRDILRAAIGYALGEEPLGLGRLREKYAAKMTEGPDRRAFDVVSAPVGVAGTEFQDVARRVVGVDTLEAFLADMRARYPDQALTITQDAGPAPTAPLLPAARAAKGNPPRGEGATSAVPPKPAGGEPLRPDPAPTGSIRRRPIAANNGR